MSKKENIRDNEVYVLGSDNRDGKKRNYRKVWWIVGVFVCLAVASAVLYAVFSREEPAAPEYYFEPEDTAGSAGPGITVVENAEADTDGPGYMEAVRDTVYLNAAHDVPIDIFIPHNLAMSLVVGMPDRTDSTIMFAAMAADIRKDNREIVGDFVLGGEQLARGVAKRGYCAIIDNAISIGVGAETPLLRQAVEGRGSFFRQYPLVHNGAIVENNPRNVSVRRALVVLAGEVMMVESKTKESFHDFSEVLVRLGVSDAIYLVGGEAWGWYRDKEHRQYEFGEELDQVPENISYIVWRAK